MPQPGRVALNPLPWTYLPPNDVFLAAATELTGASRPPWSPDLGDPAVRSGLVRAGVLGLATHNLPAVRRHAAGLDEVLAAEFVAPFGYDIRYRCGDTTVQLTAVMGGSWIPTGASTSSDSTHGCRSTTRPRSSTPARRLRV